MSLRAILERGAGTLKRENLAKNLAVNFSVLIFHSLTHHRHRSFLEQGFPGIPLALERFLGYGVGCHADNR